MKCLCCGKLIPEKAAVWEKDVCWHASCIQKFFGTRHMPEIDVAEDNLKIIVQEAANKGYTVPGVQKKMSLQLIASDQNPRLTLVGYPTGYILKPQAKEYEALPEAEYLAMQMAKETGISVVPFALIKDRENKDSYAYITKRIDRKIVLKKTEIKEEWKLYAMEDFCQLENRLTEDKYRGSYERCAKVVSRFSIRPGLDLSELFMRVLFSFVTGNSDLHLKNFSLIETSPESQDYALSAAYDLLPVQVIVPEDTEQMALSLNGKKRNIRRNDFLKFAESSGISKEAAVKMINKVISMKDKYCSLCEEAYLPESMKNMLKSLMEERICALKSNNPRK